MQYDWLMNGFPHPCSAAAVLLTSLMLKTQTPGLSKPLGKRWPGLKDEENGEPEGFLGGPG